MKGAAVRMASFWTVDRLRSWTESRPNEERWELIDGVASLLLPEFGPKCRVGDLYRHTPLDRQRPAAQG